MEKKMTILDVTVEYRPHMDKYRIFTHYTGQEIQLTQQQLLDLKRILNTIV